MTESPRADAVLEGGDLDCGSGLLLLIREAMSPLGPGGVLEIRSRESSVREDLPAWCRMVGHTIVDTRAGESSSTSYYVRKQSADEKLVADFAAARDFAWKTRVKWTGGMQAKAYVRNHTFAVGQPASFDTADPAPGAVEYLLSSLAGCLTVGFAWRASRRGIEIRNLEVSLSAKSEDILGFLGVEGSGNPGLARVEGTAFVDADADAAVLAELWTETVARSPVAQTLARKVDVAVALRVMS
jgi:uncharacterized OsmC-like protein/TusA-related sulfurtransferase